MTHRWNRRAFLHGTFAASTTLLASRVATSEDGASPIDGAWKVVVGKLDNGDELAIHYELTQDGRKLVGRTIHIAAYGYMEIEEGRIEADRFSFQDAFFKVQGAIKGDELHLEADYDSRWPYTNALNPTMSKAPPGWRGSFRPFVAQRAAAGAGLYPAVSSLPAARDMPSNGLALTPPMICGAWHSFTTAITEESICDMADAMVSTGLRDAGYNVLNLEVGWVGRRDAQGNLQSNAKFPNMKALGDYLHSLGLKMGICTSPGPYDRAGYAGSLNHEEQDAKTFASWGVDFIKHDACSVHGMYPEKSRLIYQKMGAALQACGRPIVYSIAQYGEEDVWKWGGKVGGNLWRTTSDIEDSWDSVSRAFDQGRLAEYAGPGHWNDPDYLMVGMGGLSTEECRTQMSLWCMLAAPLAVAADLRSLSADARAILLNKDLIAIDQDSKGVPAHRASKSGATEIWLRPLQEGHAIAIFNRGAKEASLTVDLKKLGLRAVQNVRDLWGNRIVALVDQLYYARIPAHGSVVLVAPARL